MSLGNRIRTSVTPVTQIPASETATVLFGIAATSPNFKQLLSRSHQVMPQPFGLQVARIDQGLKVTFQMGPAPLQPMPRLVGNRNQSHRPIHLGSVALTRPAKRFRQQLFDDRRRADDSTVNQVATNVHNRALFDASLVPAYVPNSLGTPHVSAFRKLSLYPPGPARTLGSLGWRDKL